MNISAVAKTIEILAVIIFVLFIIHIATMPWPANIILGCVTLVSAILVIIGSRQAKKKERDTKQADRSDRFR